MKKFGLILFSLVSLFMFTGRVFALTCSFNNYADTLSRNEKVSVTYEIDSNGNITKVEGLPINGGQWDNVKSQVASSQICPSYAYVGNDGTVYVFYDVNEAIEGQKKNGKITLNGTNNESNKEAAKKKLDELAVFCNGVAATKYDYTKCWDDSKVATKYTQCKSEVEKLGMYLRSTRSEVRGNAQAGYISSTDKAFTDMEKVCASAEKNINDYEKALEYKSCKEYKEAMGVNIECSTTKDDVKDNPYVGEEDDDDSEPYVAEDGCGGVFGDTTNPGHFAYYVYHAFQIIKFLGPVLVIVMSILDLVKITADPKQDDQLQKLGYKTVKRLMYAGLIFVLPTLIDYIFKLVGLYGTCGIS